MSIARDFPKTDDKLSEKRELAAVPMNQLLAYQIGGVFLLAAMLMFGSAHGLIPRSLTNAGAPTCVGVALLGFLIWHFWPNLHVNAFSIGTLAPGVVTSRPAQATASAARGKRSAAPHPSVAKQPEVKWKTIIVGDSVAAAAEPVSTPLGRSAESADATPAAESSGSAYHDGGAKRVIKSIGHFLHVEEGLNGCRLGSQFQARHETGLTSFSTCQSVAAIVVDVLLPTGRRAWVNGCRSPAHVV